MRLSIIIPVLNEAATLEGFLQALQGLRAAGHELIVADGGSRDGTGDVAAPLADRVIEAPPGRARQMNAGAAAAGGRVLLFLHADTLLPEGAERLIGAAIGRGRQWGRFDVRLSGRHPLLRVVERMMNVRSCWSGIATGDQAIFVVRQAWERAGGFPEIALMEDIALSRALKRCCGRPACLRPPVVTSSRRWEENGVVRTILLMWRLRLAYFLGADPGTLAKAYRDGGKRA